MKSFHFIIKTKHIRMTGNIVDLIGSIEHQHELFLYKFPDLDREEIEDLFEGFKKFDKNNSGTLEENEIQLMMADLGVNKTLIEMRELLSSINFTPGKDVSFLELCCASFGKDYNAIMTHADPEAEAKAKEAAAHKKVIEDSIIAEREKEAEEARHIQKQLEEEGQLSGVKAMKAFFARSAAATPDKTQSNAERIKHEAAMRKAKKEAEKNLAAAEADAKSKNKTDAEIAAEIATMAKKIQDQAEADAKAAVEAEKQKRAMRRASLQRRFEGKAA